MSLYGMMRTGISGMQGQSNRLATVADNIANASTTGYKRSSTEFSTLVVQQAGSGSYSSGGVVTEVRSAISKQGTLQYTTSTTDLAINGSGFFVVQDASGQPFLTRAGSFVPDDEGRLVNAAGFYLLGYNYENGTPSAVANSFAGLEPIRVVNQELIAVPSTFGTYSANLPAAADIVAAADLPSTNSTGATYSEKTSIAVKDNLGGELLLDIYFTKSADNTWQVAVFNQADGTSGTGFPYAGGALSTETFTFSPTNGQLTAASPTGMTIPVPGGADLELDLSKLSQLTTGFVPGDTEVNGSAASAMKSVQIGTDGTVYAQYENGTLSPLYRIPLASVRSPDQLLVQSGNVYSQSATSGDVRLAFAEEGGMGSVNSAALEASNVDIGEELTAMIESQRSYTANSKVFQTGSELMDVLVNLKR